MEDDDYTGWRMGKYTLTYVTKGWIHFSYYKNGKEQYRFTAVTRK
jgi:hypothetical protein